MAGRLDDGCIELHARTLGQLYDLEFTQMTAGEMGMRVDYVASPDCVLYRESYQSKTHAVGSLLPGKFAFAVPIREPGTRWWGDVRTGNLSPTAVSGETIDIFFSPGHAHYVAIIARERLERALLKAGVADEAIRAINPGRTSRMLEFGRQSMAPVSKQFGEILSGMCPGGGPLTMERFEEVIVGAAVSLLDPSPLRVSRVAAGNQLFRRAIERYGELADFPKIETLCAELHARPRTLETAFKKCAGMGPHRYFQIQRLNRARIELLQGCPEERRVTDIATRLGFNELGRFAVRYRELFGERPSETLSRKPRTIWSLPF